MPEWIHNRAEHLLAKNPSMPKHMAFAVATQQSHALGKSPKGYGTAKGKRVAKRKFDTPKDDVKGANPGGLESPKMASDEKSGRTPSSEDKQSIHDFIVNHPGLKDEDYHAFLERKGVNVPKGEAAAYEALRKEHQDTKYASMRCELLKIADLIPGGKGDNKTDSDFDPKQIARGEKVEQEHSKGNKTLAREIARDHLTEIPDYYTRLERMEAEAKRNKEASMKLELLKIAQFQASQFSTPIEGAKVHRLASQVPPMRKQEILVKNAFQTSQFSGPLSMGGFKQESSQPGFRAAGPAVKMAPSAGLGNLPDPGSSSPQVKSAAQGYGSTLTNVTSPASSLARTQAVGQGKLEPGPGPSIADQVKPRNMGAGSPVGPTMPGAGKSIGGV